MEQLEQKIISGLDNWYKFRIEHYYTPEVRAETIHILSGSLSKAAQLSRQTLDPEILIKELGYFGDYTWFSGKCKQLDKLRPDADERIAALPEDQKERYIERYVAPVIRGSKKLLQFFGGVKQLAERHERVPLDEEVNKAFVKVFGNHQGLTEALISSVNGYLSAQELAVHKNPHHLGDYKRSVRIANAFKDTLPYYNQQVFGDLKAT